MSASTATIAKTHLLPYDHIQLGLYKDTITFVFTTADDTKYNMPLSKGNIEAASPALSALMKQSNESKEIEIPNFSEYDIKDTNSILLILTQYLENGCSEEFDSYTIKKLHKDQQKLEDLFSFSNFLGHFAIKELNTWVQDRIFALIQKTSSNRDFIKSCLMLAIKNKLDDLTSACMPTVLGHYWTAENAGWQQVSAVMQRVITKVLPNATLAIEGINIMGYEGFKNQQNKPLPALISKLFPNLKAVKFHTAGQVPCVQYVERNNNVLTLMNTSGKWLTNEGYAPFPNTLAASIPLPEPVQNSMEVEEVDSQEDDEIESFSAETDDEAVQEIEDSLNNLQINDQEINDPEAETDS
jgi:hypothetical protein